MAKHNILQGGYLMLELIPVLLAFVLAIITLVSLLVCLKCEHALAIKMSNLFWTVLHKLSRLIFTDVIKEAHTDDSKGPRSVSQGKEVPRIIIGMIGAYCFALGLFAAMTFWDVFLLNKTYVCSDEFDCFPKAKNRSLALRPIQNCSVFLEEGTNDPVICYAFALSIGTAAGVVGGLITAANSILRGISSALLSIYNKAEEKKKTERNVKVHLKTKVLVAHHLGVVIISLLFIAATAAAIMLLQFVSTVDIHTVVYATSLLLTIVLALTIPWYKLPSAHVIEDYEELKQLM